MELLLKVILAPLLIAGIVAVFKLRAMVWLAGPPLIRNGKKVGNRTFQKIIVWNNGGQAEESISIRFPDRLKARLLASSEGLAVQEDKVISIASLPAGDRCEMLLVLSEELSATTSISVRSKALKKAEYAKAEKDVSTATGLGWMLSILLILVSFGIYAAVDFFFEDKKEGLVANAQIKAQSWPDWESVGDFDESELAKSYPPPSFPVVVGKGYRKGDLVFIPFTINNVSERVISFRISLSSSESAGDSRPWERKSSIDSVVLGPASQKNVELNIFFPKKIERGYVVVDVTMRYGDEIHLARRNLFVE